MKSVFKGAENIDEGWSKVTLAHLVTHTSGAVPNFSMSVSFEKPEEGAERMKAREQAVLGVLANKPTTEPGTTFVYSNVGYTIAGAMAEKVTGVAWEDHVRQKIFKPLGITSGGFGAPLDDNGILSQPRGHKNFFGMVISADDFSDNTPIMGPAGTIHMSLTDLARYGYEHVKNVQGRSKVFDAESAKGLYKPFMQNYGYGFVVLKDEAHYQGPLIWHNGTNTMWYALLVFIPSANAVVAIASNDGNIQAAEKVLGRLHALFLKRVAQLLTTIKPV